MNVRVFYTDDHGRWTYVHCPEHKPRSIFSGDVRDVRIEMTQDTCTLDCSPQLNQRV